MRWVISSFIDIFPYPTQRANTSKFNILFNQSSLWSYCLKMSMKHVPLSTRKANVVIKQSSYVKCVRFLKCSIYILFEPEIDKIKKKCKTYLIVLLITLDLDVHK